MWLTITVSTAAGVDADGLSPSPTGLVSSRWRFLPIAASKPVSRTMVPDLSDDRPDVEVERLQHVVRIAADEILRRLARMVPVADRVDLVDVVAHGCSPIVRTRVRFGAIGYRFGRAHLDAGAPLDRLHHGGEVLVRSVLVAGESQHPRDRLGDIHRHAERLALGQASLRSFVISPTVKPRLNGPRQHQRGRTCPRSRCCGRCPS